MSEPKRYLAKISWTQIETEEHPAGELVRWSDYARLQAEVERLRKAGDDMAFHYQELVRIEWGQMTTHIAPSIVRWNAAKEGNPTK